MITPEQKEKLMEMIRSYGVEESVRGVSCGRGKPRAEERQRAFCKLKLDQIQTFLDNLTVNQAEN